MDKDGVIRHRRPMQARSFITAVAAATLSLLLLTAGLLWGIDRRSPVSLAEQPGRALYCAGQELPEEAS